jgi:hypothetical protein
VVLTQSLSGERLQTDGDTSTVTLGPITVPIASSEPAAQNPNQYLGIPHRGPAFDTSRLGVDYTLTQGTPNLALLEQERSVQVDRIVSAVYLGDDHQDVPVYIYAKGSNHLGNLIGQIFLDGGTIYRFASTYSCCISGPQLDGMVGVTVRSSGSSSGGDSYINAEWHDLPEDISVVALEAEGQPLGWQVPVSGSVAFRVDHPGGGSLAGQIALIAYDAQGQELARR